MVFVSHVGLITIMLTLDVTYKVTEPCKGTNTEWLNQMMELKSEMAKSTT